jgi:hypothetical protein
MKNLLIVIVLCLGACATHEGVIAKDGIPKEKALEIGNSFLEKENGLKIRGVIEISKLSEKDKVECKESELASEYHGEFCDADYELSHSDDPYCIGGARVIEICNGSVCAYRFGQYQEMCE